MSLTSCGASTGCPAGIVDATPVEKRFVLETFQVDFATGRFYLISELLPRDHEFQI